MREVIGLCLSNTTFHLSHITYFEIMITVIVITKNEENRIKACLESVKWADQIIIYDNGSTDGTLKIADKYTEDIFEYVGDDFSKLRNMAMEKASGDWVLYVDADERVLEPLKNEIQEIAKSSENAAYALSRKNIIFGQKVSYGPYSHDWMIRLFKRDKFKTWVGKVHEYGTFEGELGYSKNSLLHLTHRDVDSMVLKSLEWSKIDAKLRLDANHPPMTGLRFFRILITETYEQGIKRKGFFNGTVGIMDSLLQVFSLFITYVRLWQLQQAKPMNEIYDDLDKKLIEDNFNF
jgi:glycosyltransferase involved in cell wall biosynthesis